MKETRKTITVRDHVWKKLVYRAKQNNRSVGKYVVQILEQHSESFRGKEDERINDAD